MKIIVFLIRDFRIGGGEKITLSLVTHLDRSRFKPFIVALDASGPLLELVPSDTPVINLNGKQGNVFQFPWKLIKYSLKFRKIISDIKPSLVVSGNWFMSMLCSCIVNSLNHNHVKLVIAFHLPVRSFAASSSFADVFAPAKLLLTAFLFKRAERVVAISHSMKKDLISELGIISEKISVIYNGIDINSIVLESKDVRIILPSSPYIVSVGRLEKEKGHDLLVRAFKIVSKMLPHKLVIVGDGSCKSRLEAMVREFGLGEKVIFTGGLSNPFPVMKHADFLVLPSRWEAFPFVLLEALALEIPVIATSSEGPLEILDNGGYGHLIPPDDESSLAEAILHYALIPEERWKHCKQSKARAECFSLDRMICQYERLFSGLCDEVAQP